MRTGVPGGGIAGTYRTRDAVQSALADASRHPASTGPALASLLTTSAAHNRNLHTGLLSALEAQVGTQSVWTIDLAHALYRHGFDCEFTSDTLGVSDGLSDLSYYRSVVSADEPRVRSLFQRARESRMRVAQRRVSVEEMKRRLRQGVAAPAHAPPEAAESSPGKAQRRHASDVAASAGSDVTPAYTRQRAAVASTAVQQVHRGAYIVLTDVRSVRCLECFRLGRLLRLSFAGHFIVVLDYDPGTDVFTYSNPACNEGAVAPPPCCASAVS